MWGPNLRSSNNHSKIRLNYATIAQALDEKKHKGKKDLDRVDVGNNAYVHAMGDKAYALRLYQTDIVTFYANGDKSIDFGGYMASAITKHWVHQAVPQWFSYERPNVWTDRMFLYHNYGDPVLYYPHMRVDSDHTFIGKRKPLVKLLPNAKAKALRKSMLAAYKEHCLPHLRMMDVAPNWIDTLPQGYDNIGYSEFHDQLMEGGEQAVETIYCALSPLTKYLRHTARAFPLTATYLYKKHLDTMYRHLIEGRSWFDEVPYQTKG